MQTAILFPGQGSQFKGMGKDLFGKYPKETQLASSVLGYDIETLCVNDPERKLAKTEFTQPALYVVNHLQYQELGINPNYAAGHSLGEYNALLAAGVFDFETGLRLVQKRGELMGAAPGGGMAAVLGVQIDVLKKKLEEGGYNDLDVANYNTPTQTVLSGPQGSINRVCKDFESQKIRIVPLFVTSPFHSRYMEAASKEFSNFMTGFTFRNTQFPVIANVTARPFGEGEVAKLLSRQMASPVSWTNTICYLLGESVMSFRETGKEMLTKMVEEIRKDSATLKNYSTTNPKPDVSAKMVTASLNDKPTAMLETRELVEHQVHTTKVNEAINGHLVKSIDKVAKTATPQACRLGSAEFRKDYGVDYSYIAGAMYRGTASARLVIAMGKAGMLGFLGTGGLSLDQISRDIDTIQSALSEGHAYGMNLLYNLDDPAAEMKTVELYIKKGIGNVEAAAYMQITEPLVYFHAAGIRKDDKGVYHNHHRILAKVSRPEVAEAFMRPAPERFLKNLLDQGRITSEQATVAMRVPVSHDICVEADSGGHTDGGVALVLLPAIQRLRDDLQQEYHYAKKIRVGLAGGIGHPSSAACAFVMGADFILTGSINQCTVEAGTSDAVKDLLETMNVQDTDYAPAGDMFEIGARVQVLKKGILFPARANKLYQLYNQYSSLKEIPEKTLAQLERNYFKKSIAEIWEETKIYFQKIGKPGEIAKAEQTPRKKMAMVFRWYFSHSSRLAFAGQIEEKVNFQIHTGPSLGAFNQWVKGTELESWRRRHVAEIGKMLMEDAGALLHNTLKQIDASQKPYVDTISQPNGVNKNEGTADLIG